MESSANPTQVFKSAMVTGHRPQLLTLEQTKFSKRALLGIGRQLQRDFGTVEAISGMALGVDTWWAKVALHLNLDLAAYIPFPQQTSRWRQVDREYWAVLRQHSSREVMCGESFSVRGLHIRNDRMIRDADVAVAVWCPSNLTGGTAGAVKKIRKLQMPMILVDLDSLSISRENF